MYATYQILGADSFFIVEQLQKLGVSVYNITFLPQKIILSIDFAESEKLFAISRNMCYNISIIKYYGKLSPLKYLISKVGLTLSFCVFLALAIFLDGVVTKVVYRGDGEKLSPIINAQLCEGGIKLNSFLTADLKGLAQNIYAQNERISFITLQKSGRVIIAEAYLAQEKVKPIDLKKDNLLSSVSGEVKALNVLSGTPLVAVGDKVEKGAPLIGGYHLVGEDKILTYALGEVEIESVFTYDYKSFAKGEKYKNRAIAVAKQNLGEEDIVSVKVQEKTNGKEIVYEVTVYYLVIAR